MRATVYYIELTDDERRELNNTSWSSPIGIAYLAARDGRIDDTNRHLFKAAAVINNVYGAEDVWQALQNADRPWTERSNVLCLTDFPRSMDVGDLIRWEDGRMERCASLGFETIQAKVGG